MDNDNIRKALVSAIQKSAGINISLNFDKNLIEEGLLSSIEVVSLIVLLEKQMNIKLSLGFFAEKENFFLDKLVDCISTVVNNGTKT